VYNPRVNRYKKLLSKLWKLIPGGLRWRAVWTISPRFVVGVAGVVLNDRKEILLANHVYRSEQAWGLPGGIIHYKEDLAQALYREILEETSVHVHVGPLLQYGIGEKWPHVTFQFLCRAEGAPQPVVNGELFEAAFFAPNALPSTLIPAHQSALDYALQVYDQPQDRVAARIIEAE
jgi:ADP-ribose pyrophosphatase YjhB (NUDIX family)